jgi:hypothetical protein
MFLIGDHLQEDAAGDFRITLLVDNDEVDLFDDQSLNLRQGDVTTLDGVVKASVRVLFDDSRLAHGAPRSGLACPFPEDAGPCLTMVDCT